MNEIIVLKRENLKDMLDDYYEKSPEHVFLIDLVPTGETTIFEMYPETEYSVSHTFATFLDDVKSKPPEENQVGVTGTMADNLQNFVFSIRRLETRKDKRLIIACNNGRTVSGAVALWAMDWIMDETQEDVLYKINPDIRPNEFILADLYLHPII
jgi:hypothetical protein